MRIIFEDHKTTFWSQSNKNEVSGYRERQKDQVITLLCWHEILKEEIRTLNWEWKEKD